MPALFEALFAAALLDSKQPIPPGITAPNAAVPTRRFAVHRNNVVAGLVKALRTRVPAVEKIVGEEFFAAMARAFVVEQPPRTPLLATYGDEFAAFIAAFEPAQDIASVRLFPADPSPPRLARRPTRSHSRPCPEALDRSSCASVR